MNKPRIDTRKRMRTMKELPVRKNVRLKGYDYSQKGVYFITFCVKDRLELLSKVVGEHIVLPQLSKIGHIVEEAIECISQIYNSVIVDKYVIMPNHVHMMILVFAYDGRTMCAPTISRIVKQYKEYVTKQIGYSIWQKSFHDHIVRDEDDYRVKWNYIDTNPARWYEDEYYE